MQKTPYHVYMLIRSDFSAIYAYTLSEALSASAMLECLLILRSLIITTKPFTKYINEILSFCTTTRVMFVMDDIIVPDRQLKHYINKFKSC